MSRHGCNGGERIGMVRPVKRSVDRDFLAWARKTKKGWEHVGISGSGHSHRKPEK